MKTFLRQMRALVRLSFVEIWRRNDVFALALFALALMVPLSMASPFGVSGASRYLDEAALLLIWGFSLFTDLSEIVFCWAQGRNPEREPQERGESAQLRFAYSLPSQTLLPYLSPF